MTAKRQDFEMNESESKLIDVPQTDDAETGGDLDISGHQELLWEFKENKTSDDALVTKTASGSADFEVTDSSVGAYEILINPEDTEGLPQLDVAGRPSHEYYHRVRLTDANGRESDLLEGHITVYKL